MRRIPTGTTDQYIYFKAVDSVDLVTRLTGLSSFSVYRARNGAAAAAYTSPTIAEVDSTNMAGVYSLLLDEDMDIGAGNYSEEVVLVVSHAGMDPVEIVFELYDPAGSAGLRSTEAEVSSVPGATSSVLDRLGWLFALSKNKGTQTATTKTLRNDADSADIATSGVSKDATTFTRGKWS